MKINVYQFFSKSFMAVLFAVLLSGTVIFIQSCGNSGNKTDNPASDINGNNNTNGNGDDEDTINYRDKANDLVDKLYAAKSAAEIEPILTEILTILAVPVYNHNKTAIVTGSGSLSKGASLRDYHVYVLADTFFKYRQNPSRHTTPRVFADGVQGLAGEKGPVKIKFASANKQVEFDESMVYYMANLYNTVSTTMGVKRPYFIADLFTALAEKTPKHGVTDNFYLDPIQSFLMTLDWFSKPLNAAEYVNFTNGNPTLPPEIQALINVYMPSGVKKNTKGDGMDTVKGYWSLAQFVVGEAVDTLGTVLDVGGMVAGEIIADGTQISIECDSPMYYSSGTHTIKISVVFGVDLNKFATDYGWTVGVDVPEMGPIKKAKVALDGWENLAPRHGQFSGGDLKMLNGLASGGAIANDNGQVSINFTINDQSPTSCTEENQETVMLVAEVNPITDPTAWQSGIFNSIWPRSMPFWVDVKWKKSTSACGNSGSGGYSN